MADFAGSGSIEVPDFNSSNFSATRCDDDEILENIRKVKEEFNYVVDPHTACGFQDLDLNSTHVVLATAHPAKFPDVIEKAIGERPTEESLEAIKKKKQVNFPVENSAEAVQKFVEDNAL